MDVPAQLGRAVWKTLERNLIERNDSVILQKLCKLTNRVDFPD